MNIGAINSFFPSKNVFQKQKISNNRFLIEPLKLDSVSFQGKIKRNLSNPTKASKDLGLKAYREMEKNPQNPDLFSVIKKEAPDIQLGSIEEVRKIVPYLKDYGAYFSGSTKEDFSMQDCLILVSTEPTGSDKNKMMLRALDIAHEYTHYQYRKQDMEKQTAKQISDNWQYFGTIQAIASHFIFNVFDNEIQAEVLLPFFNNRRDIANNIIYSRFLPYEKEVDKEKILALGSFQNEKNFKAVVDKYFDIYFIAAIKKFQQYSYDVDAKITNTIRQIINEGKVEQFKKDIRIYCASMAQDETNAYTTEAEVAREILKTDKSLNIDAYPCYYQMLHDAFLS